MEPSQIARAIDLGIQRLLKLRQAGRWMGFPTLAGVSDTWVTGFVTAHLRDLSLPSTLLRPSIRFVVDQQRLDGGWSYGKDIATDADSTAWCLAATGGSRSLNRANRERALTCLDAHSSAEGVSTYRPDSGIAEYMDLPHSQISGWTAPHPDVTASTLLAFQRVSHPPRYGEWFPALLGRQTGAGFFESYWWRGPHYLTTLLLRVLARAGLQPGRLQATRTLRALEREELADGGYGLGAATTLDAFTTALALESLSHLAAYGGQTLRRRTALALLAAQELDGSWAGGEILRIPAPDVRDPAHVVGWRHGSGGGNSFVTDVQGVFSTVLACYALQLLLLSETQPGDSRGIAFPDVHLNFKDSEELMGSAR